jgi:hypothetical protein
VSDIVFATNARSHKKGYTKKVLRVLQDPDPIFHALSGSDPSNFPGLKVSPNPVLGPVPAIKILLFKLPNGVASGVWRPVLSDVWRLSSEMKPWGSGNWGIGTGQISAVDAWI